MTFLLRQRGKTIFYAASAKKIHDFPEGSMSHSITHARTHGLMIVLTWKWLTARRKRVDGCVKGTDARGQPDLGVSF